MAEKSLQKNQVETLQEFVVFHVDNEQFALPIADVREVLRMTEITPVPQSPDFISGIINLRGKVIAVMSLEKRFALTRGHKGDEQDNIIIVDIGDAEFGVIVDSVSEVLRVDSGAMQPAPSTIQGKIGKEFIHGVIVLRNGGEEGGLESEKVSEAEGQVSGGRERIVLVLNLQQVLSKKEHKQIVAAVTPATEVSKSTTTKTKVVKRRSRNTKKPQNKKDSDPLATQEVGDSSVSQGEPVEPKSREAPVVQNADSSDLKLHLPT